MATIEDDLRPGVELVELTDQECLDRLVLSAVGRLGLAVGALPVILPVNYVLDGRSVVFLTGSGTKLDAAAEGNVACLEIDELDPVDHLGWSVLATGRLQRVDGARARAAVARLPVSPWRHIDHPVPIRLSIDLLSGRRLQLAADVR